MSGLKLEKSNKHLVSCGAYKYLKLLHTFGKINRLQSNMRVWIVIESLLFCGRLSMFTSRYCVCGTCPYILKVKQNEREREREKKKNNREWVSEWERESNFRRRGVSACSGTSPDFPHSCTAWSTVSPVDIACLLATGSPQAWFSHPCLPGATKPLSGYIKAIYLWQSWKS